MAYDYFVVGRVVPDDPSVGELVLRIGTCEDPSKVRAVLRPARGKGRTLSKGVLLSLWEDGRYESDAGQKTGVCPSGGTLEYEGRVARKKFGSALAGMGLIEDPAPPRHVRAGATTTTPADGRPRGVAHADADRRGRRGRRG